MGWAVAAGRKALLISTGAYTDARFAQLRAPAADIEALSAVLCDPGIGDYSVSKLVNAGESTVRLKIADFFAEGHPDDLLLLYLSGHGIKDDDGQLYFAVNDSRRDRPMATAVSAAYVREQIRRCRAHRIVVWLDCCFGGAFPAGMRHRGAEGVDLLAQLRGRGTAVMTASSELEYAFEPGGETEALTAEPGLSVFTQVLTDGLRSGDADRNGDGFVDIDELYDFVYDQVRAVSRFQTPQRKFDVEGKIYVAASPRTMPARAVPQSAPDRAAEEKGTPGGPRPPRAAPAPVRRPGRRRKASVMTGALCGVLGLAIAYLVLAAGTHWAPFSQAGPAAITGLAATYYGTMSFPDGTRSNVQLCSVSDKSGRVTGSMIVWYGSSGGSLSGSVTSGSVVNLYVSNPGEPDSMHLTGSVHSNGDITGSFSTSAPYQKTTGTWAVGTKPVFKSLCG
jgi:Caspase domain